MPPTLYLVIRLLHFAGMAVWFGGAMTLSSDVRKTLARGKPHTDVLAARVDRSLSIGAVAAIVTMGTGLAMIFAQGGFGAISPRIHAGFALALVAFAVELLALRPAVAKLGQALASGEEKDLKSLQGRIGMLTGVLHTLKLVILVLMVWKT